MSSCGKNGKREQLSHSPFISFLDADIFFTGSYRLIYSELFIGTCFTLTFSDNLKIIIIPSIIFILVKLSYNRKNIVINT